MVSEAYPDWQDPGIKAEQWYKYMALAISTMQVIPDDASDADKQGNRFSLALMYHTFLFLHDSPGPSDANSVDFRKFVFLTTQYWAPLFADYTRNIKAFNSSTSTVSQKLIYKC